MWLQGNYALNRAWRFKSRVLFLLLIFTILVSLNPLTLAAEQWDLRRIGYNLIGYSTSPDATVPTYSAGFFLTDEYENELFAGNIERTTTLYAIWEKETYTIYFDSNGGAGASPALAAQIGGVVRLPASFSREEYILLGFSTLGSASYADYADASFTLDETEILRLFQGDTVRTSTLYAIWEEAGPETTDNPDDVPSQQPEQTPSPTASPAVDSGAELDSNSDPGSSPNRYGAADLTSAPSPERDAAADTDIITDTEAGSGPVRTNTPGSSPSPETAPTEPEQDDSGEESQEFAEENGAPEPESQPYSGSEGETWEVTGTNIRKLPAYMSDIQKSALQELEEAGVPIFIIGDGEVQLLGFFPDVIPIYGVPGIPSWALLNLILCVLGLVLAVIKTIRAAAFIMMKRKWRENEYAVIDDEDEARKRRPKSCNLSWLITVDIIAVASLVFFLTVADMSLLMVFVDVWTTVFLALFVAVIITKTFVFSRKEKSNKS